MDEFRLKKLLESYKNDDLGFEQVVNELRKLPYENLDGFARLDHHRQIRRGAPEVIFGEGKRPEHLVSIFNRLSDYSDVIIATRIETDIFKQIEHQLPEDTVYNPLARILFLDRRKSVKRHDGILVCSAGTADVSTAEEAALTAELLGNNVNRVYDIGVAGLHRLLDQMPALMDARVIIVVAGMEGALASVVAGLVSVPVIAVPTSIGYGASFNGLAALLAMLNSCSTGLSVVNIDNGFGAGYLASTINQLQFKVPMKNQEG